jgi:hypothetical protein
MQNKEVKSLDLKTSIKKPEALSNQFLSDEEFNLIGKASVITGNGTSGMNRHVGEHFYQKYGKNAPLFLISPKDKKKDGQVIKSKALCTVKDYDRLIASIVIKWTKKQQALLVRPTSSLKEEPTFAQYPYEAPTKANKKYLQQQKTAKLGDIRKSVNQRIKANSEGNASALTRTKIDIVKDTLTNILKKDIDVMKSLCVDTDTFDYVSFRTKIDEAYTILAKINKDKINH